MQLQKPVNYLFEQLSDALQNVTDQEYCFPSSILSQATIGQHLRHIIEFFLELQKGYETGFINYDNRDRDRRIETDKMFAMQKLSSIVNDLPKPDKTLTLLAALSNSPLEFQTNYYRELLYNLEHTVHHMALIRVGVEEISSIKLSPHFGVAESTLQSRKVCAQ